MIVTKSGGSDFDPVSAGVHPAILIWQVDVGSQENKKYGKWQRKVMFTWEIPGERIETDKGNQPRVISKTYTATLGEKGFLYADLVSWRGRDFTPEELDGFDLAVALGKACQVNVVHKKGSDGKVYANVATVLPYKGQMAKPENPVIGYDIDTHGLSVPEALPEWIQKRIKESPEYKALENGSTFDGSTETPANDDTWDQFAEEHPASDDDLPDF